MRKVRVRQVRRSDSAQIAEIYRPIVEDTVVSFEVTPPDVAEISRRIDSALEAHEWLVAEYGDEIGGYAYATSYRSRPAYRYSTETTVYVHQDHRREGVGRLLYLALFESLKTLGYRQAYAGIALPNEGSVSLHKAVGFEHIGIFKDAGFKFGHWHHVSWWQRRV